MYVYVYLVLCVYILLLVKIKQNIDSGACYYPFFWFSCLLIVIVGGFRVNGGVDYQSYVWIYESLGQDFYTLEKLESGFYFLNYLAKEWQFGYEFVFFVSYFVAVLFVFLIVKLYSPYPALSVLILFGTEFIFFIQNVVRQGISVAIFFYSIRFIIERRFSYFLLSILVASLFHETVLLFFPLYFLSYVKYNRFFVVLALLFSIILLFDNSFIMEMANMIDDLIFSGRYSHLLISIGEMDRDIGMRPLLFTLLSLFVVYFFSEKNINENDSCRVFVLFFVIFVFLSNALNGFNDLNRLTLYLLAPMSILIPIFIGHITKEFSLLLKATLHSVFVILFSGLFYLVLLNDGNNIFPYDTVLF